MKAYGSLTIVDLLDTATYIYYAEDKNGTGVKITPDVNSQYIGIYSGKTLPNGQPNPELNPEEYNNIKDEINWSRYSITIDDDGTSIEYAISTDGQTPPEPTSDKWEPDIPTLNKGEYLWTKTTVKYSDGNKTVSYSVSYSGLDGNDANTYYIETNQKEILRFVSSESSKRTTVYSPIILSFSVYEAPVTKSSEKLALDNDSYELQFLSGNGYSKIENPSGSDIENSNSLIHYINDDDNTVLFNVEKFYNSMAESLDALGDQPHFFRFLYYDEDDKETKEGSAIQIIESRLGMGGDLATFMLHAGGFNSAIQETKLEFDANGLTIKNGGLYVYDSEGNKDLYFDNDKLVVKGRIEADSGSFKGKIEADSGSFTGTINTAKGEIGGFKISEGILYSSDGETLENSSLVLYGAEGKITAKNIELGIGASITDYIKLGSSYLYNPDEHDGIVLKANNIKLKDDGTLNLGTICLNGGSGDLDGYIRHEIVDENGRLVEGKWAIYENGHAEFKDITADNVTLKNSVLEIGTIQSAGSLMVFKEAWKIDTVESGDETLVITLKEYNNKVLTEQDRVFIKDKFFKIKTISEDNSKITLENPHEEELAENDILIRMGREGTDYIISISGSSSSLQGYDSPNSLTISDFHIDDYSDQDNNSYTKHLILGDLSNSGILELEKEDFKFGLYSDNVYLNGSLITKNQGDGISAGISTTHDQKIDGKRIIFWAGADTTETDGIKKAPFRVTQDGSIYANKGLFEGSIITDSIIQGSDVYTMRLHGTGKQDNALKIYGGGISFFKEEPPEFEPESESELEWENDNKIFKIGINGFEKGADTFIDLAGTPIFNGNLISDKIRIEGNIITINGYNILKRNELLTISQGETNLVEISSDNIRNKVPTYCDEDFWLGNKMHYQKVLMGSSVVGYDLYVED